jgi:photosystem II stability/assembly factor-like uncharacterized protein
MAAVTPPFDISADPLIAEAKARTRRRRLLALSLIAAVAGAAGVMFARNGAQTSSESDVVSIPAPPLAPATGPQAQVANAGSTGPVTWALGNKHFWLTADAGVTWRPLPTAFGTQGKSIVVNAVGPLQFIDRKHGWVFSGAQPRDLYRTIDGGRTWIPTHLPQRVAENASSLFFVNPTDGYVLSNRTLRATQDGGATWQVVSQVPGPYGGWGLAFSDRLHGFFVASGAALYRTADGGHTWRQALRPRSRSFELWTPSVFGRQVVAPDLVHVGDGSPERPIRVVVYSSSDGGETWASRAVPKLLLPPRDRDTGPPTIGFTAVSPTEWVAQRGQTLLVTTDAGRSWRTVTSARHLPGYLIGTGFSSPRVGWALLQGSGPKFRITLLRTTDGGRHWKSAGPRVTK